MLQTPWSTRNNDMLLGTDILSWVMITNRKLQR